MKTLATVCLMVSLSGCALNTTRTRDLAAQFNCLRNEHLAVAAAHRGQPDQSAAILPNTLISHGPARS